MQRSRISEPEDTQEYQPRRTDLIFPIIKQPNRMLIANKQFYLAWVSPIDMLNHQWVLLVVIKEVTHPWVLPVEYVAGTGLWNR